MLKRSGRMIVLIILAIFVFFWIIKAPLLSSYLSSKMRIPVSISSISFWPSETLIHNLRMKNPSGFRTKHAFEVKEAVVDYHLKKLLARPAEIDQIFLDAVFSTIEFTNPLGTQNNWTAIAENMPKTKSEKTVIVHKLILQDVTVEIRGLGLTGAPTIKKIDRLEFNEVSSEKGFPTQQFIQAVFRGAGIEEYIQNAFDPKNLFDQLLTPF